MTAQIPVLMVDDDPAVREALVQTLELSGYRPISLGSFVAAKDHIVPGFQGVILSDIRMPGRDGFHLLRYAQEQDTELPVVLLTGEGDIPMAVAAMEQGAFDFLEKPCAPADLLAVLARATAARRAVMVARAVQARRAAGDPASRLIFGTSTLAEGVRARVRSAAAAQTETLVTGAPGSGISKVAEVIHLCSAVAGGPFEKRAAAGLDRAGLFAAFGAAAGGSLFLDEAARLPEDTQIAVVEALEAGSDVRLIAGSSDPAAAATLNPDLYYRLEVVTIRIPALSERREDIPVLFRHYVAQASEQAGLPAPALRADHLAKLMAQDWPGNARALMSAAMRFVLGIPEPMIEAADLGLAEQVARLERALLIAALDRQKGRASDAARQLKLPRKTFYDKLSKYGIRAEDYRP